MCFCKCNLVDLNSTHIYLVYLAVCATLLTTFSQVVASGSQQATSL